jgi:sterol desaturase/sphingolipid hydroxylase (fatty acid hydroxylase superfamily)
MGKSTVGIPGPEFPRGVDLAAEARISRGRLYRPTVVYLGGAAALLGAAFPTLTAASAAYFAAGVLLWTYIEYVAHRWVLHRPYPDGKGLAHLLHRMFDHMHWEHHQRPWDGTHISGSISSTMPFMATFAAFSLLTPLHTVPVTVAGFLVSYVLEEWCHHSTHFYSFKNRYFRYIKAYHLYHHSAEGADGGFGLTNAMWDVFLDTGYRPPRGPRAA